MSIEIDYWPELVAYVGLQNAISRASNELGCYRGMPNKIYQSIPWLSNSRLHAMQDRSPLHYLHAMKTPFTSELGDHFNFGSAFHTKILQPEEWENDVAVLPDASEMGKGSYYKTNEGKKFKTDFQAKNCYRAMITRDQERELNLMSEAVMNHPVASNLILQKLFVELSVFFELERRGKRRRIRSRIDLPIPTAGIIADLKTTRNASLHKFTMSLYEFGYFRQGAIYLEAARNVFPGDKITDFVLIAIENYPPYAIAVYRVNEYALEAGHTSAWNIIEKIEECEAAEKWPSYSNKVLDVGLTNWANTRISAGFTYD